MSLDWSTSMGEVDGLSLILTDLHVPALTPWLHLILHIRHPAFYIVTCSCILVREAKIMLLVVVLS